jgi:uncharacterized protein
MPSPSALALLLADPGDRAIFLETVSHAVPHLPTHDSAHDVSHCERVAALALHLAEGTGADLLVLALAAFTHDLCNPPKNSPLRSKAAEMSAEATRELFTTGPLAGRLPPSRLDLLTSAVLTHSFSAGRQPACLEGALFQDADRLDAVGAIGIARCFATAGAMKSSLVHPEWRDPARTEELDDRRFAVDHFQTKLIPICDTMVTERGKAIAAARRKTMEGFLDTLKAELDGRG